MTDDDIRHLIDRLTPYIPENHQGVRAPYELCDKVRTALLEWLFERQALRDSRLHTVAELEARCNQFSR